MSAFENVTKQRVNSRPYILICALNVQARKQSSQVPVLAGLQQLPPRPVAEDTACLGRRHAFGVGDDLENRVPLGTNSCNILRSYGDLGNNLSIKLLKNSSIFSSGRQGYRVAICNILCCVIKVGDMVTSGITLQNPSCHLHKSRQVSKSP